MLYPKIGIRPVIDGRWGGVRESLETQTMDMAKSAAKPAAYLDLKPGDMVQHNAFGKGMVLSVLQIAKGGDAMLEIAFDQIGTKKLMAKTASAYMKKL